MSTVRIIVPSAENQERLNKKSIVLTTCPWPRHHHFHQAAGGCVHVLQSSADLGPKLWDVGGSPGCHWKLLISLTSRDTHGWSRGTCTIFSPSIWRWPWSESKDPRPKVIPLVTGPGALDVDPLLPLSRARTHSTGVWRVSLESWWCGRPSVRPSVRPSSALPCGISPVGGGLSPEPAFFSSVRGSSAPPARSQIQNNRKKRRFREAASRGRRE